MSALKRKQETFNRSASSSKKRQKLDENSTHKTSNAANPQTITAQSLLSKEQPAFPRGGAGPLTILERKQIRAKASNDVAKELEDDDLFASKQNASAALSEDGESDIEITVDSKPSALKRKKKKKSKSADGTTDAGTVRIESLSRKMISEDSLLLGRIANIGSKDLTISLPNNLTGFVSLVDISSQFSSKLEKAVNDASDDDHPADDQADVEIGLENHFKPGQMLRVAVKETESATQTKESRKRINLSTMPKLVNRGLTRENLAVGITVQAAVISVEDHGLVVDLGFEDNTTGFVPRKTLPSSIKMSDVQVGAVFLCAVTNIGSKGKAVQLSANLSNNVLAKTAASIDAYLPGTIAEVLLTQVTEDGLAGKVLGLLDVTADIVHSAAYQNGSDITEKYQSGQKVTGRLIANFPHSDQRKLAFSVVDTIKSFDVRAEDRFELSSILHRTKVVRVVPGLGIYLSLPSNAFGFAHISRLSDKSVDSLSGSSGQFKIGSEHEARILDYNSVDRLYILSLQRSVLDQPYLRLEDVKVVEIVTCTVERLLLNETGVRGLLLQIAPGIHGIVKPLHFSDTTVHNPEKKFREGMSLKARVLTADVSKRQIELTLKKSIVNSDQAIWSEWYDISPGDSSIGTIIKIEASGAIMQFYGSVKGRLPVSEMSEAYIKDATEHFKLGQVLTVHAVRVDAENRRLVLTARDPTTTSADSSASLAPGTLVSGTVFEKSADDLLMRLGPHGVIGRLHLDHVADGSTNKRKSALEKIRVGQQMEDILILDVRANGKLATISNKKSLRNAAREGTFLKSFEDLVEGAIYTGFISNITENRVFVCFASNITGVVNKPQIPEDQVGQPEFGMKVLQPVSVRVVQIDYKGVVPRFWLSMKTASTPVDQVSVQQIAADKSNQLIDPIDDEIQSHADLVVGLVTKARITSVKDTQINVELAKGVQGRVDVSELFDSFEDIKDRKHPLRQFSNKQILTVRILGQHDSRTYKFLPLSHRGSKNVVFELSARPSMIAGNMGKILTLKDIQIGSEFTVFVNNVSDKYLMVNVTPGVRGRIQASDASDDLNLAANLAHYFPVGSAMKAKVTAVDVEKNRLDLSAKTGVATKVLTIDNVSAGDIVAGRITKITDHSVLVQLSESLVGSVELINMADNFDLADPARFSRNEIVRACILQVDKPNKRVHLSMRPSKILSSSLEIADPEVTLQSLSVNDVRRGFVDNVSDKGIFVKLAPKLNAFVRVTNLSDDYFKEWKEHFQKHQLVKGKIIAVDKDSGHVQMSLRKSHVDGVYRPKIAFTDLKVGDIVEAKVAKVQVFGIFVEMINSERIRGLCHRSEIAEKRIEDATTLGFSEGDMVKAKVLKLEPEQRRVNFGMKASYFADELEGSEDDSDEDEQEIAEMINSENEDDTLDIGGVDIDDDSEEEDDDDDDRSDQSVDIEDMSMEGLDVTSADLNGHEKTNVSRAKASKTLSVGGFDWFGMNQPSTSTKRSAADVNLSDSDRDLAPTKKKKRKPEILIDHTADLDTHGPQTPDDFDRLLLTDSANASLWIQYMAHYISLGDTDAARSTGSRALASIPASFESEKQLIWVAMLNLENTFGDDETVQATLQQACETMEPEDMHARLASIYIQSDKHDKADELFQSMLKKFTQNPKLWTNYATFLFDTLEAPVRARALLPRALQALPPFAHFDITSKFAQLEFKTKTGVPEEGRTRFQGLVNLYPKRLDLFNVMLDLEMKLEDKEQVRGLFEQVLSRDGLKPAKAKPFFQRWLTYERKEGDERKAEEVEARAAKWVAEHKRKEKAG